MELENPARLANLPLRLRGSYSNKFRSVNVCTNHYRVELANFQKIFIFSIRIQPFIPFDNKTLRQQVLKRGDGNLRQMIKNPVISGNNIFTVSAPELQNFELKTEEHTVQVKLVKVLDCEENPKVLLSFLNNGLRNIMRKLNYTEIGRSGKYFNVHEKKSIDNLMMFSGYKSNFVLLENGYSLRVDSVKKIVRNQTVLDYINEIWKMNQDKERLEKRNILQNNLVGKIVMTNYGSTNYHRVEEIIYEELDTVLIIDSNNLMAESAMSGSMLNESGTISGSSFGDNNQSQMTKAMNQYEGKTLRYYYEHKYNIHIKNLKQPLLRVESKRRKGGQRILLVPELLLMTGIPESVDQFRRRQISAQTILDTGSKQREIGKLMNEMKDTAEFGHFKEIGIKINSRMQVVSGKIIPIPRIALGQDNFIEQGREANFTLYDKPIYASKHSVRCGIIYFNGVQTRQLIDTFERTSRNLNVKLQVVKINAGDSDLRKGVSIIGSMIIKAVKDECNVCCIIIPNPMRTQYKKIKHVALVEQKVVCQIVNENTLRKKGLQSIATKILLQIIAKRGNTLWVPKTNSVYADTIICAFEQAKVLEGKYNLSLCATINSTFSSIFSTSNIYEGSENKFQCMSVLLQKAVDSYLKRNKEPPKQIIIFQNSCSGDQIKMYQDYFIAYVKKEFDTAYHQKSPCLTFIMVNVKTSERFFTEGEPRNMPAGTLVSQGIVSNFYDFYMVSQSSNKGSTVPNHYKVIYSDSKIEQGCLQELIFSQCFNYFNWTGSIKVPGILQYASRCAKFNAEVLDLEEVSADLQNKLYFV